MSVNQYTSNRILFSLFVFPACASRFSNLSSLSTRAATVHIPKPPSSRTARAMGLRREAYCKQEASVRNDPPLTERPSASTVLTLSYPPSFCEIWLLLIRIQLRPKFNSKWRWPLFNSLRPSETIWYEWIISKVIQEIAYCLMAPSYYLNQGGWSTAEWSQSAFTFWGLQYRKWRLKVKRKQTLSCLTLTTHCCVMTTCYCDVI